MSTRRKLIGLGILVGAVLLLAAACGGNEEVKTVEVVKTVTVEVPPKIEQVNWTLNHCSPVGKFHDEVFKFWADRTRELSGGLLNVDVQGASVLGYKCGEALGVLSQGLVEASELITAWMTSEIPLMNLETIPFLTSSYAEGNLLATIMRDEQTKQLKKFGVKPLFNYCFTGQHYWTKKPINSLDDIKGVKMRVYNKTTSDMIKLVGAEPVTIDMADVYTALQRGVVDGGVTSALTARDFRFDEVLSYGNAVYFAAPCSSVLGVNLDAWNKLPGELQAAALDAAADAWRYARIRVEDEEISLFKELESRGMKIVAPPPEVIVQMREKTAPMLDELLSKVPEAGPIVEKYKLFQEAPG